MTYQDVFDPFWDQVKESIQEGRFAKLTMAKTIGKPNLKNIFVRPICSKDDFKVLVKLRYASKETEDEEKELTLEDAFEFLKSHLKTPFSQYFYLPPQKMSPSKLIRKVRADLLRICRHFATLPKLRRILNKSVERNNHFYQFSQYVIIALTTTPSDNSPSKKGGKDL